MSARALPTHIDLPALLRRDALIDASSIDVEARTVDIVWSTGARRLTWSWEEWELIEEELDLAGADLSRLNNGAPFLKDHWAAIDNQLGVHVDGSAVVDLVAKQGRAKIRFSKRADVEPYWQDVVDKITRQVSVGYQVQTYVVTRVEGKAPLYRATKWTPLENSLVAIGADPGAQVQRQAGAKAPTLFRCQIINNRSDQPKDTNMAGKNTKPSIPNQKRAMADDVKTKCSDILKEYGVAEDKLAEATDKIAALWPEETAAGAGTQSADLKAAAKALGTEDASPKGLAAAATTLRALYDAKAKELDEAELEDEEDEFEANEKAGKHRGLERVRAGFARETYDSNIGLYRSEVGKVKDITKEKAPSANPSTRKPIDSHRAEGDDAKLAAAAEVEEKRLMELNPKLTRQAAYAQAVKNVQAKKSA